VNSAITQVDGVTQANSTQTRQLASTAQSLAAQSKSLMDLLGTLSANKPTASSLQL
jgi:methyl-accepting chemotaxis protein